MATADTFIGFEGEWAISTDGETGASFIVLPRVTALTAPGITVGTGSVTTQESTDDLPVTENFPTGIDYGSGSITVIFDPLNRAISLARANVGKRTRHVLRQTLDGVAYEWVVFFSGFTPSADIGDAVVVEIGFTVIPQLDPHTFGLPTVNMTNSDTNSDIVLNERFSGRGALTYTVGDLSVTSNGVSQKPTVAANSSVLTITTAATGDGETTVPITATDSAGRTATATLTVEVS